MPRNTLITAILICLAGTTHVLGQGAVTVSERLDFGLLNANASYSGFGFNWATLDSAECYPFQSSSSEVLAHAEANCNETFDCGALNGATLATAYSPIPVGAFSAAPYAAAVTNGDVAVSAGNNCEATLHNSGTAGAYTLWRVNAEAPNRKGGLIQELFVWVVINGGEIRILNLGQGEDNADEDAEFCPIVSAYAEVDGYFASGSYAPGSGTYVYTQGFGIGQPIFSPNGVNQGFHLIRPISGTRNMQVNAASSVGGCYGVGRFETGTESAQWGTVGLAFFTIR